MQHWHVFMKKCWFNPSQGVKYFIFFLGGEYAQKSRKLGTYLTDALKLVLLIGMRFYITHIFINLLNYFSTSYMVFFCRINCWGSSLGCGCLSLDKLILIIEMVRNWLTYKYMNKFLWNERMACEWVYSNNDIYEIASLLECVIFFF